MIVGLRCLRPRGDSKSVEAFSLSDTAVQTDEV